LTMKSLLALGILLMVLSGCSESEKSAEEIQSFELQNIPVDKKIKKARLSALQSLLKQQQINYNKSFVGKEIEVLFDRKGRYENQYIGRSIYNQSVFIDSNRDVIGKSFTTKINRSTNFALEAVL